MRTVFRYFVSFVALVFGAGTLSPIIQANWQAWAQKTGNDQYLVNFVGPLMNKAAAIAQQGWFIFAAGFFAGGAICLWVDRLLRRSGNVTAQRPTTSVLEVMSNLAHGLTLENAHVGIDKIQKNIQVGFNLRNSTVVPIRYEVQDISAVVNEKTVANPTFDNRGGVVARGGIIRYNFPPIDQVVGKKTLSGRASIVYRYGPATEPEAIFIREANYTVNLTIGPKGSGYTIIEENDGPL